MARCGCSGSTCSCKVVGGGLVNVSGSGSAANPYTISVEQAFAVNDTSTVDLTMSGTGSAGDPYTITADAAIDMVDIVDFDDSGGSAGDVVALQGDGTYALNPPSTASPGAINTGDGLSGDGSGGDPLELALDPNGGLTVGPSGLSSSAVMLPSTKRARLDAEFRVVAKGTSGTASRVTGLSAALTNPSASANILCMVEQHGWVRIAAGASDNIDLFLAAEAVGGTPVDHRNARVFTERVGGQTVGYYREYRSWVMVALAPSASVTAYARIYTGAGATNADLNIAVPSTRYTTLAITPLSVIDPATVVLDAEYD
jgi:hypothetical protein